MMDPRPGCYILSLEEMVPLVPEKIIFEGDYHNNILYGRGDHLGHVIQAPRTNFSSPYPRMFHIKIWLSLAKRLRRRCLKLWTTRDAEVWVYCKLTYEPLTQVSYKSASNVKIESGLHENKT